VLQADSFQQLLAATPLFTDPSEDWIGFRIGGLEVVCRRMVNENDDDWWKL
jgi:hypothetical protein